MGGVTFRLSVAWTDQPADADALKGRTDGNV
jgi:hypothetical protein